VDSLTADSYGRGAHLRFEPSLFTPACGWKTPRRGRRTVRHRSP